MDEMNKNEEINDAVLPDLPTVDVEAELEMKIEEDDISESKIETKLEEEMTVEDDVQVEQEAQDVTSEDYNLVLEEFDIEKREDQEWQDRTGLNVDTLCGALETVIFMSDRPVPLIKMRNLIDEELPLRVLHNAISRLQEEYESKHHGLRLLEVAEGYQFRTKATYSKYVQDLFKVNSLVLTPSALEVLAIIAYKQPVSKTQVEKIRGVDSSHIVRGLMDKRLVKMMGRSDEMGRPTLYGTTAEFLEVFNLSDLAMLPSEMELEELSETSIGQISDIKTICNGDKKQILNVDELEELDRLSLNIKNISSETEFTNELKLEEKKRNNTDGTPIKSVFELLEEHVSKKSVSESNVIASESEVFGNILEPKIIHDLTLGPFNVPELEEDDDWQMIDLDTGESIENEVLDEEDEGIADLLCDDEENDVEEIQNIEEEKEAHNDAVEFENLFSAEATDEGASLAKALEDAFNNMQTSKTALFDDEDSGATEEIENSLGAIDTLTDKISKDAEDMDIDLSFLNDSEK